jgi:hypothetical protein
MTRLPSKYLAPILLALACDSCGSGGAHQGSSDSTGITGTVRVGPIRPLCLVDEPCTAPFSSNFEVRQGSQVVARFTSDSAGRFLVYLPPGKYTVGLGPSVGIIMRRQIHEVTVGRKGLTSVELEFDRGISRGR